MTGRRRKTEGVGFDIGEEVTVTASMLISPIFPARRDGTTFFIYSRLIIQEEPNQED